MHEHDEDEDPQEIHDAAVQEEKRQALVASLVLTWNNSNEKAGKKLWASLTKAMEFAATYPGFSGADKKKLALGVVWEFLQQTNSPGPDYVVDRAIMWIVEYGVDALYDSFKGKFSFDGE